MMAFVGTFVSLVDRIAWKATVFPLLVEHKYFRVQHDATCNDVVMLKGYENYTKLFKQYIGKSMTCFSV